MKSFKKFTFFSQMLLFINILFLLLATSFGKKLKNDENFTIKQSNSFIGENHKFQDAQNGKHNSNFLGSNLKNSKTNWNEYESSSETDERSFETPTPEGVTTKFGMELDKNGEVTMGVSSKYCDDAKTHLERDWNGSPVNYTCFHPETPFPEDTTLPPQMKCLTLPKTYRPKHFCMNTKIHYDHNIPSYGDHRPLWPKYGEYIFLPTQRWLHNVEVHKITMKFNSLFKGKYQRRRRQTVRKCQEEYTLKASTPI